MKNILLLRTNLILCALLTAGFVSVSIFSYASNIGMFRKEIEHESELTSESIFYQINSYFSGPVSVSVTMANDSLLKRLLAEEMDRLSDAAYLDRIQEYLNAYKEQYGYDSVFLVSTRTGRYYHYSGLDRVLTVENPENQWYYRFLSGAEDYALNVDNDESRTAGQAITTFVNCKIYDDDGDVMGVIGVGLRIGNLQGLLRSHKEQYGIRAMLVNDSGVAAISSEYNGENLSADLFDNFEYINTSNLTSVIAETGAEQKTFWVECRQVDCLVTSRFVPVIQWHLIVENDTSEMESQFRRQLLLGIGVAVIILLSVLVLVNKVVLAYNDRLLKQVVAQELEYYTLFKKNTEEMYADVYEFDITKGRAVGEKTQRFFESLGLSGDTGFAEAMKTIAEQQVKDEFRPGFLDMATPEYLLEAFQGGIRELNYDAMMNTHWEAYHWVRIRARLFLRTADQSVHMIIYSQDIHDEKERENRLRQESLTDPLTGLYNRRFMEEQLGKLIKSLSRTNGRLSILMIDIDFFKKYNDTYGHTGGDACLREVAGILQSVIKREDDYVARYGGEEFIAILPNTGAEGVRIIAERMLRSVADRAIPHEKSQTAGYVTVSIGGVTGVPEQHCNLEDYIRLADKALYTSKTNGRNRYTGEVLCN